MISSALLFASVASLAGLAKAQCPFADGGHLAARGHDDASRDHVAKFDVDDGEGFLSSDAGGPMEDQESLRAGERGPTLLEDFILRQKITHFDHERVLLSWTGKIGETNKCRSQREPFTPGGPAPTGRLRVTATLEI